MILQFSCRSDRTSGVNDANRQTWLATWPTEMVEHRFVLGRGNKDPLDDEWIVNADDSYGGLQLKQRAAYARAVAEGVQYVFVCFTDTYIHVPRLLAALPSHEYVGRLVEGGIHASGGVGYWLGPRALAIVADWPNEPDMQGDEWDGHTLARNLIFLHQDVRYGTLITRHLSPFTGGYRPEMMHKIHEEMRHD